MNGRRTYGARLLVVLTSLALLLLLAVPGVAAAGIKDRIGATLARYGMGGSGTSVAVYDLTAKRAVYQLRPDVLRLPASNEKLVTSSAALAAWTASFRFSTQLFIDAPGPDADGVVDGDVYLRGFGDPTLSTTSFQKSHYGMETGDIHDFVSPAAEARRDAHHRPGRGRRRVLRRRAQRGELAAEHDRLLRSALGAHAQRELLERRRLRRRPGARRRRRADEAAARRRHPRVARRRSRRRAGHVDAGATRSTRRPWPACSRR